MTSKEKINMLNGLVLAGGRSKRMGADKSEIKWHDTEQRNYVAGMLDRYCNEVFISCREGQVFDNNIFPLIKDAFPDAGPLGAILSAFQKHPDTAWLIVACDLPLLDDATLQYLIENRNTSAIATTFLSPHDGLPEPLITIWEPSSLPLIQHFFENGFKCPRKVLTNSEKVSLLQPKHEASLINANTPEDATIVRGILHSRHLL